jgi:4-phosphopantoate--beta-alanine ligase
MDIPKSHPRYRSLLARKRLADAAQRGLVVPQGLIAQGRGEAFDYLLGEKTTPSAMKAERAAAAYLVLAGHPVISVNGNVAALAARDVVELAKSIPARIEVNLFHRTELRVRKVAQLLMSAGAKTVLGVKPDARIPGLDSKRALCSRQGIYSADVVLVPLEDGDRTQALAKMDKVVLAVDLNPMSRTSLAATVTIVDELSRALANVARFIPIMKQNRVAAERTIRSFDNESNLREVYRHLQASLRRLRR